MTVLVAYASRHGATRGIAERIGERLRAAGLDAEVRPVAEVRDLARYDAFVVGAAAYMFHWLGGATSFVRNNRALLASHPTWLFSSGPVGTDTVDKQGRDVLEATIPKEFPELRSAVRPRGEKVFFGALDPAAKPVGLAERFLALMPASKAALPAGDFRDWRAIEAWADQIASELGAPGSGKVAHDRPQAPASVSAEPPAVRSIAAGSRLKPVIATLFGIPAAAIVLSAANGVPAPIVGEGAAALLALWILGSAMCALGISAMRERFGGRANITGTPLGLVATALVFSGLFGWPLILRPIVDALGGPEAATLTRAAIVGVGGVMVVKWTIAWLTYLPRRTSLGNA